MINIHVGTAGGLIIAAAVVFAISRDGLAPAPRSPPPSNPTVTHKDNDKDIDLCKFYEEGTDSCKPWLAAKKARSDSECKRLRGHVWTAKEGCIPITDVYGKFSD